jgi:hypothetical protein
LWTMLLRGMDRGIDDSLELHSRVMYKVWRSVQRRDFYLSGLLAGVADCNQRL